MKRTLLRLPVPALASAHLFEITIMVLSMSVLSAWSLFDTSLFRVLFNDFTTRRGLFLDSFLLGAFINGVFALPLLLLVRFVPNRVAVNLAGLAWLITVSYLAYARISRGAIQEIREMDVTGLFKDSILLGVWIHPVRIWILGLVAILGGFYAVRHRFSYLRLVLGTIIAGYAVLLLQSPFTTHVTWWEGPARFLVMVAALISLPMQHPVIDGVLSDQIQNQFTSKTQRWIMPACCALFSVILVSLPIQRARLERLLGISLSYNAAATPLPFSFIASMAGHVSLFIIGLITAWAAAIDYFERQQFSTVKYGGNYQWRSRADRNAFVDMQHYFRKDKRYPQITEITKPANYDASLGLIDQISSATREKILSQQNAGEWQTYLGGINKYTTALEAASQSDYLQMPPGEMPNFSNMRDASRAIGIRSQIAARAGCPQDAANDIGTLIRIGGLLSDQPDLVSQLIGIAIRNIALRAAYNLLAEMPHNAELLNALAATFEEGAHISKAGLDYTAMQTGSPGVFGGAIIPNAELVVPALDKANYNSLSERMNVDLVRLAFALQLYKINHGMYPDQLNDLVPTYIAKVPREPFEGREYQYTTTSNGWYELTNSAFKAEWLDLYTPPLYMPPHAGS